MKQDNIDKSIGRIAILCPMTAECEYLVSQISEKREKHVGGYTFYEGKAGNLPVVVARCLIGTVNAAVCTAYVTEHYSPKCVIIQGTSGAHNPDLNMNDIVIAERIVSLTNTVSPELKIGEGSNPFKWEGFGVQSYSKEDNSIDFVNAFFCDKRLVSTARNVPYTEGKLIVGTVGCGDVWNKEADLILHFHKTLGTQCEAMEGIGVAQVCAAFGVPMIEIRVISNNELHENEHFSAHTAVNCQKFVLDFLKKID